MQISEIIKADFRNIYRDPTLLAAAVAPFLILLVTIVGLPFITNYILNRWDVDITSFHRIIKLFFILIISMIYGMISVFIILDDRDEAIISFIKVTPFSIKGYLLYRVGFAFISSALGVAILSGTFYLSSYLSLFDSLFLIIVVPLESIFMALFIVSFAKNKVEGLALSKMIGIIPFSAFGAYFLTGWTKYLFAVFPPFWIIETVEAHIISKILIFSIISVFIHLLYVAVFMKIINKKLFI